MSDTYFRYVPVDPAFKPTADAAAQAVAVLRSHLHAESIAPRFAEAVEFVDAGGNWEGVSCPACGSDAAAWWAEAMSQAAETQFESLQVRAGCCGALVSLNELRYGWPVAFGSFILEVANPSSQGLPPRQLEQLGTALGCAMREVKVHV